MGADRLERYREKRSASATPEPFGARAQEGPGSEDASIQSATGVFVVQMHHARNLHFDLRLEMNGALESWAVPKGPSPNPADKRLAMHVEPHPIEYADFEGVIPEGQYGAGPSICWDRGSFIEIPAREGGPPHGIEHGKLLFELRGHKLKGLWTLVHTPRSGENHWLLIKERDGYVDEGGTEVYPPDSILSGLTVDQLPDPSGRAEQITSMARAAGARPGASSATEIEVMKATAVEQPFSDPDWVFEIKYDGYRLLSERTANGAQLISRNGNDLTDTFPEIARAVRGLPWEGLVLDGEVVVHDAIGMPSFSRLQKRGRLQRRSDIRIASVQLPATYYAFDLLSWDGLDLRDLPLLERKQILREVLPTVGPIRFSDHIRERGEAMFEQALALRIEGIVGKRADSRYSAGRSESWAKIRTVRTDDFVVVGWTEPKGSRGGFGALHLAQWSDEEEPMLLWTGPVGTGFSDDQLDELGRRLEPLERPDPPAVGDGLPTGDEHHWVEPQLVVEVRFKEFTEAGMLRHPSFQRVRDDKPPGECRLEGRRADLPEPAKVRDDQSRVVALTNQDKLLYPPFDPEAQGSERTGAAPAHEGITKGEMIAWYEAAAEWMLPWLRNRCLVLTRYPDGISGTSFYQKNAPDWAPDWIRTETVYSEGSERDLDYFVVDDLPSLRYVANSAALLLHIWSSRVDTLALPDWCILDLDPKEAPFEHVIEIALLIREIADSIDLPAFVKTSGSSGLHILLPLGGQLTWEQSRQLAQLVATIVAHERSDIATIERSPSRRDGKVYVDFLQNGWGKLLVAPYSTRPVPEASVSMPLHWDEVGAGLGPRDFTIRTGLQRLRRWDADPALGVLDARPDILKILERLMERVQAS